MDTGNAIDYPTFMQGVLETCEPYMSAKLSTLSSDELRKTYVVFSHPHCSSRLSIVDSTEAQLIKLVSSNRLSFPEQITLLKDLTMNQIGSDQLM